MRRNSASKGLVVGTEGKSRSGRIHAGGQTKAHDAHWDFPVLAERSQGQLLHVRKNYAVFWVLSTTDDNKLTQFQEATRKRHILSALSCGCANRNQEAPLLRLAPVEVQEGRGLLQGRPLGCRTLARTVTVLVFLSSGFSMTEKEPIPGDDPHGVAPFGSKLSRA